MEKNSNTLWDLNEKPLKARFGKSFMVGNIISPADLENEKTMEMYAHHYNALTCENAMKPIHISPEKGKFFFDEADAVIDWCKKNNVTVIGHTLVWHGQSPKWLYQNDDGTPLTQAEALKNMEHFIKEYAGRYADDIYSWDVLNEAVADGRGGDWKTVLRQNEEQVTHISPWYLASANGGNGEDYIFYAFYYARKYAPKSILYYNDYNDQVPEKAQAIYDMVVAINDQWKNHPEYDGRLLIEGIGMQGHYNEGTDLSQVDDALALYIKTGCKIAITELDITFGDKDNPAVPLTAEQAKKQAEMYKYLFDLFEKNAQHIERVTFWGKKDSDSWRAWGSPLPFDVDGKLKFEL